MLFLYSLKKLPVSQVKDIVSIDTLNTEKGVPTENIVTRLYQSPIVTNSQFQKDNENVKAIIVKPKNIESNFENFVKINFHNLGYIKTTLKLENVYDIFDNTKIQQLKRSFDTDIDMKLAERFKEFNENIPYKHIAIDEEELQNTLKNLNSIRFKEPKVSTFKTNIETETNATLETGDTIRFTLVELNYGFGDFLQRYDRILQKFLQYSSSNFELVKTCNSYSNKVHGSSVLNLKNFPAFDHIPYIETNKKTRISLSNLMELLVYDRDFFINWNKNYILEIDLSSTPGLGRSKNPNYNYLTNEFKNTILRKPSKPDYRVPEHLKNIETKENRVIFHFRRNDYVDMILSNSRSARTINTLPHLFTNFVKKVRDYECKEYDVVIISDHYDKPMRDDQSKYRRILFDYNYVNIGDVMDTGEGISIKIVDKIIGKSEQEEMKFIEEILKCKYLIGNMSCLPNLLAETLESKIKNISRDIVANVRNTNDLDNLLENLHKNEK